MRNLLIFAFSMILIGCNQSSDKTDRNTLLAQILSGNQSYQQQAQLSSIDSVNQQLSQPQNCSQLEVNQQIVANFETYYLFRDQMQVPIDLSVLSPSELVQRLRVYEEEDFSKWIDDKQVYFDSFSAGVSSGRFGFSTTIDYAKEQIFLQFVETNSPAWHAGLRRGDEILSINRQSVSDFLAQLRKLHEENSPDLTNYYLTYLGSAEQVKKLELQFVDKGTILISKADYVTSSIEPISFFSYQQQDVAYLKYHAFSEHSQTQLESSFVELSDNNVQNLIVDLRHNTGGLLSLAEFMVNALLNGEQQLSQQLMYQQRYNSNLTFLNRSIYFSSENSGLSLSAVTFIVDAYTCSASEMVINSLLPYVNVNIVGAQKTCGKPYGMNPIEICEGILFPVTLEMVNAQLDNNYKQGFTPTCLVNDVKPFDWANTDDPMLKQSMQLATGGQCESDLTPSIEQRMLTVDEEKPDYIQALEQLESWILQQNSISN